MQVLALLFGIGTIPGDEQTVLLGCDVNLILGKTGYCHGNPVVVFACDTNVVGRVAITLILTGRRTHQ